MLVDVHDLTFWTKYALNFIFHHLEIWSNKKKTVCSPGYQLISLVNINHILADEHVALH